MQNLSVYPRSINRTTILTDGGGNQTRVIYPSKDPAYRHVAENIASTINKISGVLPILASDEEVMPGKLSRLPDEYRNSSIIILGNINTNRLLVNLYARHKCFTDADYPGGDGYELRTVINPYVRGKNAIVVGGSNLSGVIRAADRLNDVIQKCSQNGQIILPFLLDIELNPALKKRLDEYPYTDLKAPKPGMVTMQGYEIMRVIGHYSLMYAVTGDRRYGEYGADCLRLFNNHHVDSYGDRHYFVERMLIAIYWLQAGGFFSHEEVGRMDQLILGTLVNAQHNWWRRKDGEVPLGHRHHSKGTYEFLMEARFIRENANISPEVMDQCDQWIRECQSFLDALCQACIDDQDDETSMNNMSNLVWYSLSEERFDFFESGNVRQAALRALALTDNMGAGAGQGGYGEAHMSAMYTQIDATTIVSAAAFYYQDGQLKWLLEHIPYLKEPLRGSVFIYCPIFLHNFATGNHLVEREAEGLVGIQVLPITGLQYTLSTNPPEHIVPLGHFVNEPETWLLAEGIGRNHLTQAEGFDKITLRDTYHPEGAYILLQGYQGGFNWQGLEQAANCIVRFSQYGKIFLIQNSRKHTAYDKNGVFISNGWDTSGLSPYARKVGMIEDDQRAVTITSVPENRGGEWKRYILWTKTPQNSFLVIDSIQARKEGDMSLTCVWRTPAYAEVHGQTLVSGQKDYVFRVMCGEDLPNSLVEEPLEGAASPYVWRQFQGKRFQEGEVASFHNFFYARPESQDELYQVVKLDTLSGYVKKAGIVDSYYRINPSTSKIDWTGISTDAELIWVAKDSLIAVNTRLFKQDAFSVNGDTPFSLILNSDGSCQITSTTQANLVVNGSPVDLMNGVVELNVTGAVEIIAKAGSEFADESKKKPVIQKQQWSTQVPGLKESWQLTPSGLAPQRIRDVRIACDPSPANGFDEQLIDQVPLELREFWTQWYEAPEYKIHLSFPKSPCLDTLRFIVDSYDEPMMRTFNPLPDNIEITSILQGIPSQHKVESVPEVVTFQRYRGQLDRMAGHRSLIGKQVDSIDIIIPAPKDRPFILQEIEAFGAKTEPVKIKLMVVDDLTKPGSCETILVTETNEVILLDRSGEILWRQKSLTTVCYVTCLDLLGNGTKFICLGTVGGELRILMPSGDLYHSIPLDVLYKKPLSLMGWIESISFITIWRRDAQGHGALAVGSYATVIFLDTNFNVIGDVFADGAWIYNVLLVPQGNVNANDVWVRTGWNHGINVYKGIDSFAASKGAVDFGGVLQPLFRDIKQVIPFVNGDSVAFDWIDHPQGGRIMAAAAYGLGLMNTVTMEWVWLQRGYPHLTGCVLSSPIHDRVFISGMDGFITTLDLETGKLLQTRRMGKPVVGLCRCGSFLAAATLDGVSLLNDQLETIAHTPLSTPQLIRSHNNQILVIDQDQKLHQFTISEK